MYILCTVCVHSYKIYRKTINILLKKNPHYLWTSHLFLAVKYCYYNKKKTDVFHKINSFLLASQLTVFCQITDFLQFIKRLKNVRLFNWHSCPLLCSQLSESNYFAIILDSHAMCLSFFFKFLSVSIKDIATRQIADCLLDFFIINI